MFLSAGWSLPLHTLFEKGAPFYNALIVATLELIEEAALKLSPDELAAFRRWFAEFDTAGTSELRGMWRNGASIAWRKKPSKIWRKGRSNG